MYLAGIQLKLAGIAHVQIPWKTHLYRFTCPIPHGFLIKYRDYLLSTKEFISQAGNQ
jgi:hypothetical protein